VGKLVGCVVGTIDGRNVGWQEGIPLGCEVGGLEGDDVGCVDGIPEG
jgi:hypothetical protein